MDVKMLFCFFIAFKKQIISKYFEISNNVQPAKIIIKYLAVSIKMYANFVFLMKKLRKR